MLSPEIPKWYEAASTQQRRGPLLEWRVSSVAVPTAQGLEAQGQGLACTRMCPAQRQQEEDSDDRGWKWGSKRSVFVL